MVDSIKELLQIHIRNKKAWGGDKEVAKASTKKGRKAGKSPVQIADAAANGCGRSETLWWEYAAAVKGKSRLYWGPGLKAKCGIIKELTDEELIEQENEKADALCQLEHSEWRLIRQTAKETTGVLDAAESGGLAAVRAYIEQLKDADKARIAEMVAGLENKTKPWGFAPNPTAAARRSGG